MKHLIVWARLVAVFHHGSGPLVFQACKAYYYRMKKAIQKARGGKRPGSGRKPTGVDPTRTIRLSDDFIAMVDAWSVRQEDKPSRSEAIRRLVELGLKVKSK